MLEGSHGMPRDADAAVALLEEKVKDGDAEAMWMLGMCCEFGMGTYQDIARADQLYQCGAEQGSSTARLLMDELKNKNGRGCAQMDLAGKSQIKQRKQGFVPQKLRWTENNCCDDNAKVLASMLLMHVPLITLDLSCKINSFVRHVLI